MLAKQGKISRYVFPDPEMDHITPRTFRRAWTRYCKANGFKNTTSPYELRHTFVSINDEMPEAFKKMVVGHSVNMDTEKHYSHEKQGDMERAAGFVDAAFDKYLPSKK